MVIVVWLRDLSLLGRASWLARGQRLAGQSLYLLRELVFTQRQFAEGALLMFVHLTPVSHIFRNKNRRSFLGLRRPSEMVNYLEGGHAVMNGYDRTQCAKCEKMMMPRTIYHRSARGLEADPVASHCPFCLTRAWDLNEYTHIHLHREARFGFFKKILFVCKNDAMYFLCIIISIVGILMFNWLN